MDHLSVRLQSEMSKRTIAELEDGYDRLPSGYETFR